MTSSTFPHPQLVDNPLGSQAGGDQGGRYSRAGMGAGAHEVKVVIARVAVARAQGLPDSFMPVQVACDSMDVGRVITLFAALFQQVAFSESFQQLIQKALFQPAS